MKDKIKGITTGRFFQRALALQAVDLNTGKKVIFDETMPIN
jgi:hypothetical protein